METAKANKLEPYRYLRFIFDRIPLANSVEDYQQLLPQFINREQVNKNLD
ncbi:MAG: transposase domain-containing protein [bacterium]